MKQQKYLYYFHHTSLSLSFLELEGNKIIHFEATLPCIEAALNAPPDAMILDLDNEQEAALKIITTFRMPQLYKKVAFPILILKTHISAQDVKTLHEAGVNAIMTKPFKGALLKSRLKTMLSEKLEMQEEAGIMRAVPQFHYENEEKITPTREIQTWLV